MESIKARVYSVVRWTVLCLSVLPLACSRPERPTSAPPRVVATTSVICDLTQQLAGGEMELTCLLSPSQDPHSYTPTPSHRAAIDDADLVLYSGYDLVPTIEQLIDASDSLVPQVAIFEVAVPEPLTGVAAHHHHHEGHEEHEEHAERDEHAGHKEHEEHEEHHSSEVKASAEEEHHHHEHEEDHGSEPEAEADREVHASDSLQSEELVIDPHVWHSAANGVAIVEAIAAELVAIAPASSETIDANADQLIDELTEVDEWIHQQVATVPISDRNRCHP